MKNVEHLKPTASTERKAIICALLASLSMALVGFFSKSDMGILQLLLVRFLFPLVIISFIVFAFYRSDLIIKNVGSHLLRSCFVMVNQIAFFYMCKHGSLLVANLLFNTAPIFIPIIGFMVFKEKSSMKIILSIGASAIGMFIMFGSSTNGIPPKLIFIGLLSGLALAASQIVLQKNVRDESNLSCMFWFYFLSSVISLLMAASASFFAPSFKLFSGSIDRSDVIIAIGMTFSTLLYQFFTGLSYKFSTVVKLAPFVYSAILFSGILDIIFWKKYPSVNELVGMVIIASSCIVVMKTRGAKKQPASVQK